MRELFLFPEVQSYNNFEEFAEEFLLGETDLIITTQSVAHGFIKKVPKEVRVIYCERYGKGEPSDTMFDILQADAMKKPFERVIAIGGGTCIDIAKMLCVADGRPIDEIYSAEPEMLEHRKTLIVIPTTCGTGSEVTVTAVFDRKVEGTKVGLTNYAFRTDYAVLIPSLLDTLPAGVFANSSIDALIHAIESYLDGMQSTDGSKMFAERAILMILPVYRRLRRDGMECCKKYIHTMQLAALYAGVAIANALPSASHAMSYPFSDKFHRPHGEACYVFLDASLHKYLRDVQNGKVDEVRRQNWKELMAIISRGLGFYDIRDAEVLEELDKLLNKICPRKPLREYGASIEDCVEFGEICFEQQQRLLECAFTPFTKKELIETFKSVW